MKLLGCLHNPISYTGLGINLYDINLLVEYMNRITFGAFFTPEVFLLKISIFVIKLALYM